MRRTLPFLVLLGSLAIGAAPTTGPTATTTTTTASLPAVDRLQSALSEVGLSDEQHAKVAALVLSVRTQLAGQDEMAPEDRRDTYRQVMGEARRQLATILTDEQQVALRDRMQIRATAEPTVPPKVEPTVPKPPAGDAVATAEPQKRPAEAPMTGGRQKPADVPPAKAPPRVAPPPAANDAAGATGAVGTAAADFSLNRLKSGVQTLASLKNRVVVLEFGSYSAPPFRYRSAAMDALAKEFAGRAEFVTVYTAEAYPAGEWDIDRNKTDNVSITRHADAAARLAAAERARATLRPARTFVLDTMDDATARAYRAGPHSAVVIGRDGVILARQQWCDPDGLRRHIEAAVQSRPVDK